MAKIIAITSGTCYDCSWEPLVLPEGLDLEAQKKAWRKWYDEEYCPGLHNRPFNVQPRVTYIGFTDWLRREGARDPRSDELEVWENY